MIDLTGDDDPRGAGGSDQPPSLARSSSPPSAGPPPHQQPAHPVRQTAPGAEFACHRCGAGFDDPVALVAHDGVCAGREAAAAGVAGRGRR
jgi:hypothetical protein